MKQLIEQLEAYTFLKNFSGEEKTENVGFYKTTSKWEVKTGKNTADTSLGKRKINDYIRVSYVSTYGGGYFDSYETKHLEILYTDKFITLRIYKFENQPAIKILNLVNCFNDNSQYAQRMSTDKSEIVFYFEDKKRNDFFKFFEENIFGEGICNLI